MLYSAIRPFKGCKSVQSVRRTVCLKRSEQNGNVAELAAQRLVWYLHGEEHGPILRTASCLIVHHVHTGCHQQATVVGKLSTLIFERKQHTEVPTL